MDVLDYRSSFVINTSAVDGVDQNTCRTQIMARCVVDNRATGECGDFFLGKECIGETMYSDAGIAQVPTSEVSIVFSQGKSALNKNLQITDLICLKSVMQPSRGLVITANPHIGQT